MSYEIENQQAASLSLKTWLKLIPYIARKRGLFLSATIFMLACTAIEASFPLFTRYAVDNFVMPQTTQGIWGFAVIFFLTISVSGSITPPRRDSLY